MTKQTAFNFSHRFYGNSLCMGLSETFWKYASIFIDNCGFPKQNIFALRLTRGRCASYHNITIHWAGEMQLQKKRQIRLEPNRYPTFLLLLFYFCLCAWVVFCFLPLFYRQLTLEVTALKTNWRARYVRLLTRSTRLCDTWVSVYVPKILFDVGRARLCVVKSFFLGRLARV